MPNRVFYEKLREKKRLAHEKAQKVQEERRRAREMKEEKWTTKNEFELVSEHRKMQRNEQIEKIRKEGLALMELTVARIESIKERDDMLVKQAEEEAEEMSKLVDEYCAYIDEIEEQISPPRIKSVDAIVEDIEKELRKVFNVFMEVYEFNPKMPEIDWEKDGKGQVFAKEIAQMEKDFEKSQVENEDLEKKIAEVKLEVEKEKIKCEAKKQEKELEVYNLDKQLKQMQAKLEFLQQEPEEKIEIDRLKGWIEEEEKRHEYLLETKKLVDKMMKKAVEEKEKKEVEKAKKRREKEEEKQETGESSGPNVDGTQ